MAIPERIHMLPRHACTYECCYTRANVDLMDILPPRRSTLKALFDPLKPLTSAPTRYIITMTAMITDTIVSAFESDRLIFRTIEDNKEIRYFIHTQLDNDPTSMALGGMNLIKPGSTRHTEEIIDQLAKAELGVIIFLLAADTVKEVAESDEKRNGRPIPIGHLSLGWGGKSGAQSHHRSTYLGITLAAPYQNKGYGGEAINWALDWAFRFGGYHRVEIHTVSYNERARTLYKKLGFVEEGRSREAYWYDRKWYDVVHFGILDKEWETLRAKSNLKK